MKKYISLLSFLIVPFVLFAQFEDNFDDNSFPSTPDWFGNTDLFVVNASGELQNMDTAANTSYISTSASVQGITNWDFYFRMELAPSTSNQLEIYLQSDQADLTGSLNGYFLRIGASGADDAIELRLKTGTSSTLLLSGSLGSVAANPAQARVKVTRDDNGNWELLADYTGGTNFVSEGTVTDNTHLAGDYFGFVCEYTSSNVDAFFFDDIMIAPLFVDMTPPTVVSVMAISATEVDVTFDEALDPTSAENTSNYEIDNGINVTDAMLDGSDPTLVHLTVDPALESLQDYILTSSGIQDLTNNPSVSTDSPFSFLEAVGAEQYDILINEFFPDPNPVINGLPEEEFVELYNRSNKVIDLDGFQFNDSNSESTLPSFILLPDSYLILCKTSAVDAFVPYGDVLGVPSFPGLTNGGEILSLLDQNDEVIHSVTYSSPESYNDEERDGGGYTIELVNPNLYCQGGFDNWQASLDPEAGTPGRENSVFDNTPDTQGPALLSATIVGDNQVRLSFDDFLDASAEIVSNYSLSPSAGTLESAILEAPENNTVILTFQNNFEDMTTYTVTVNNITDCLGNPVDPNTTDFTYFFSEMAERFDVIITEIMADPTLPDGGTLGLPEQEYIELYNRSDKVINLENHLLSSGSMVMLPPQILMPGEYIVLYEADLESFGVYGDTLALDNFVSLSNTGDEIILYNPMGEVVNAVFYTDDWYQSTSKDDGSWSLELINPNAPCEFENNWRASVDISGGTPAQANSVLDSEPSASTPLDLTKAFPVTNDTIRLYFNKAVDVASASDPSNYTIDGLTVTGAIVEEPSFNTVLIALSSPIFETEIYTVTISSAVTDCQGSPVGQFNSTQFAIPVPIDSLDLIINEVLFFPETGGSRFVELYNRSEKVINLADLNITDRNDTLDIDDAIRVTTKCLLFPGEYIVLTPSPIDVRSRYVTQNPRAFLEVNLPSFNSILDEVVIYVSYNGEEQIIDELRYTRDYHFELLNNQRGVSLERIDFESPTDQRSNWHSASQAVGFATPTYLNSQTFTNPTTDATVEIQNATFSPNEDGFEDFLLINFAADKNGYSASIDIYDAKGRLVKKLANNELLGSETSYKWDGDTSENSKARIGVYVLFIELFSPDGSVEQIKKTCVVAGQL